MRFRLRTLLVVFLLLCVSAPWWPDMYDNIKRWTSAPKPVQRPLRTILSETELTALLEQVRPGMTIEEINQVLGFKSGAIHSGAPDVSQTYWTFQVRDSRNHTYVYSVDYVGFFKAGRLDQDGLYSPL
jgi:hypothetical protein